MAALPGETNGKFVKFVLSIAGAALLGFSYWMAGEMSAIAKEITAIRVAAAAINNEVETLRRDLSTLNVLVQATSREQIDRTTKFGELNTRLSLLEKEVSTLSNRFDMLSNRTLDLHRRVDEKKSRPDGLP